MKAHEWIDRLKVTKGISSDYAVAKILGISTAAICKIKQTESTFSDETSMKVALLLDMDPLIVLSDQAAERSKNDQVKKAWSQLLDTLKGKSLALAAAAADGDGWRKR